MALNQTNLKQVAEAIEKATATPQVRSLIAPGTWNALAQVRDAATRGLKERKQAERDYAERVGRQQKLTRRRDALRAWLNNRGRIERRLQDRAAHDAQHGPESGRLRAILTRRVGPDNVNPQVLTAERYRELRAAHIKQTGIDPATDLPVGMAADVAAPDKMMSRVMSKDVDKYIDAVVAGTAGKLAKPFDPAADAEAGEKRTLEDADRRVREGRPQRRFGDKIKAPKAFE